MRLTRNEHHRKPRAPIRDISDWLVNAVVSDLSPKERRVNGGLFRFKLYKSPCRPGLGGASIHQEIVNFSLGEEEAPNSNKYTPTIKESASAEVFEQEWRLVLHCTGIQRHLDDLFSGGKGIVAVRS